MTLYEPFNKQQKSIDLTNTDSLLVANDNVCFQTNQNPFLMDAQSAMRNVAKSCETIIHAEEKFQGYEALESLDADELLAQLTVDVLYQNLRRDPANVNVLYKQAKLNPVIAKHPAFQAFEREFNKV